jgi:gamma-glutamyltranspeptidase / glutathione hydrolase
MQKPSFSLLWKIGLIFSFSLIMGCSTSPLVETEAESTKTNFHEISHGESRVAPIVGTRGMIAADDAIASEWGAEVLRRGGNAMDAAVAVGFALAVTRPHYAALGGGGFLVYCPAPQQGQAKPDCEIIDYREKAPSGSHRDMFLDEEGEPVHHLPKVGALASGVPGTVDGLLMALERYGSMERETLLSRPIEIAENGFAFTAMMENRAERRWDVFNDEAKRLFGCQPQAQTPPEKPCAPGQLLVQKDLAQVLRTISQQGRDGFYAGSVARSLSTEILKAGGLISLEDLRSYRSTQRQPVTGTFLGHEIVSMSPPSAGGSNLVQMLRLTEHAHEQGLLQDGFLAAPTLHAQVHAMSLAFSDRATFFGDPDFVSIPLDQLLSKENLIKRWNSTFKKNRKNLPRSSSPLLQGEPMETTHFSVIDAKGNAVSITTTVNWAFGSGFVPKGTGVLMNNEMDDFSMQPGVPNSFGLVGTEANAIAPGKRPLSSMSPTIVRDGDGNVRLVLGAAGGPRITTSVYQTIVNRMVFGMSLPDAVSAPRFHHQWMPEPVDIEKFSFSPGLKKELQGYGYVLQERMGLAHMHALERFPESGLVWGAPDPRAEGAAVAE